jgi:putative endonuclease
MQQIGGWTYILASEREGLLYTGATPDLVRRVQMHRQGQASHYTRKHGVTRLVWYEPHPRLENAALRSNLIRHCRRKWKIALVTCANPEWLDLFEIMMMVPGVPVWTNALTEQSGDVR